MQIDGLRIERVDGLLRVSLPEPPQDAQSDDVGELVFVPIDQDDDDTEGLER